MKRSGSQFGAPLSETRLNIRIAALGGAMLTDPVQFKTDALAMGLYRPIPPFRVLGATTATKDGSTGQTYSAPVGMTGIQWYREALASPFTQTLIDGATTATYVAQAADEGYRMVARGAVAGVPTDAVALMVVLPVPTLLFAFDDSSSPVTSGPIYSTDTAKKVQGTGSLYVEGQGPGGGGTWSKNGVATAPATWGTLVHYVDNGDDPLYNQGLGNSGLRVAAGTSDTTSNALNDGASEGSQDNFRLGGYWVATRIPDDNATISAIAAGTSLRVSAQIANANTPANNRARFDSLLANAQGRAAYSISFDDGYATQAGYARSVMEARGLRGTVYVPTAFVGGDGRYTWAQLRDMADNGWDIQLDGTSNDTAMNTFPYCRISEGAGSLEADLQAQIAAFAANGLPAPKAICYPNGTFRTVAPKTYISALNTTLDSDIVTITSGTTASIAVGNRCIFDGAPTDFPGARVLAIVDSTHVQMDKPAVRSHTGSRGWFVDDSSPFTTGKIQTMLADNGIVFGRTTMVNSSFYSRFGFAGRALIAPASGFTGRTGSAVLAEVDAAIARNTTRMTYTHAVTPAGGGLDMTEADFTLLCDYLATQRDAGLIDVLTTSQLWARDGASGVPV